MHTFMYIYTTTVILQYVYTYIKTMVRLGTHGGGGVSTHCKCISIYTHGRSFWGVSASVSVDRPTRPSRRDRRRRRRRYRRRRRRRRRHTYKHAHINTHIHTHTETRA